MSAINDYLDQYIGQQIPGGCDHCDAYQTVHREFFPSFLYPAAAGVEGNDKGNCVVVHHDDDCPFWLRYQNRQARREAVKRAKRRRS